MVVLTDNSKAFIPVQDMIGDFFPTGFTTDKVAFSLEDLQVGDAVFISIFPRNRGGQP